MFALELETEFAAAHAIVIGGVREPAHGHTFHVRVTVGGENLDGEGLLCDFHALERQLHDVIAPFRDRDLNITPPFDRINPTAERLAEHVGMSLGRKLPAGLRVESVRVTEATGCAAVFRPTPTLT